MSHKYWAVMRDNAFVLTTFKSTDQMSYDAAEKARDGWQKIFPHAQITIEKLSQRAQAEQVSVHGRTEARGWELAR